MKRGITKAVILGIIFLAAVVVMEIVINTSGEDLTQDMAEATLPVIYLEENGVRVNELFGHTAQMDTTRMRDTITPLNEDYMLPVTIKTYGNQIQGISYQVRSIDSERLVEDTKITDYRVKNGSIKTEFPIQNILEEEEEYQLIITLTCKDKEIYYYTRIIDSKLGHTKECVDFAMEFHSNTLTKNVSGLTTYLETDGSQADNNLCYVNIHSSVDQICWSDFDGKLLQKPVISIKEINSSYNVVVLQYIMTATGRNGELEYYNVEEDYRIRYTEGRMYLLEFDRTMNQIFRLENCDFSGNSLILGIRDSAVDYMSNENGTAICFVQEGELWSYSQTTGSIAKVFSFRGYEGMDARENNNQHQIRIIKVDETGSADFIVYGYMSRGVHEGRVGIAVNHYDSVANTVEEELWIPFDQSYQVMKEEVGRVLYVNEGNVFYLMVGGTVYCVDLSSGEQQVLAGGQGEKWLVSARNNSRIAWCEGGDANKATKICLYDMETQQIYEIQADEGEYIRPLGFLGTDFIYGVAKQKRVKTDAAGNTLFPMNKVIIINSDNIVLKEYSKKGYFVSDIRIEEYSIQLDRVRLVDGAYVEAASDTIVNMAGEQEQAVSQDVIRTDSRQTQVVLTLNNYKIEDTSLNLLTPKAVLVKEKKELKLEERTDIKVYYSYTFGRVTMASTEVADVIMEASANMGVVVDSDGKYVWKRARKSYCSTLPGMKADTDRVGKDATERCLSVMLGAEDVNVSVSELLNSGKTTKAILADTLPDVTVLDLQGCTVEELLYYVSSGTPVYALASATKPVLIVGYDSSRVILYDPSDNATHSMDRDDAEEMFAKAGNVYLAYIRNKTE